MLHIKFGFHRPSSEKKIFENVTDDSQTLDHGYTLSSREPNGSDELKHSCIKYMKQEDLSMSLPVAGLCVPIIPILILIQI